MKMNCLFIAQLKEQLKIVNHSMESLSNKTNISLSRMKDIFNGKEPTINELYLLSINLQININTLVNMILNNKPDTISSLELEQLIENQDVPSIINLLVNNRLIKINQRLHYMNQPDSYYQMVSNDLSNKLFDLLLKHNCINLVRKYLNSIDELTISSIYDLDKYGSNTKEELLFGLYSKPINLFQLTDYLISLINNIKTEEKIILLKEIEKRYLHYRNELIHLRTKGKAIVNLNDFKIVSQKDKYISVIDTNDFSKIIMFEEGKDLMNRIKTLQHECNLISNKI